MREVAFRVPLLNYAVVYGIPQRSRVVSRVHKIDWMAACNQ